MLATALNEIANAAPTPEDASSIKALILDDCQFDRTRMRRLFDQTDMPITVHEIANINSLQDALKSDVFDVALIDYNLAGNDGFDALDILKKNAEHAATACIMITGDDQSDVAVKALKNGCSDYISKDCLSADRLRTSVLSALADHLALTPSEAFVDVEKLADTITRSYSNMLQPEIAGLLRQVRSFKSSLLRSEAYAPQDIQDIEQRCMVLWNALKSPVDQHGWVSDQIGQSPT